MKFLIAAILSALTLNCSAISARSYVVTDMMGNVLDEHNAEEVLPIASITKLVTATKAANYNPEDILVVTREDIVGTHGNYRRGRWRPGMYVTRDQLLNLALVTSDNVAANTLGRTSLIMPELPPNTQIVESSGAMAANTSTAVDVAEIARNLYHTDVAERSVLPGMQWGKHSLPSTNPLIGKPGWVFHLSKTGYTRAAGGCLVVITEWAGQLVTVVILGSDNVRSRWLDLWELRRKWDDSEYYKPEIAPYKAKPKAKSKTKAKSRKKKTS